MPETRPASTSEPVRYWRVRNMTARQHTAGQDRAVDAAPDGERGEQDEQGADRGRDREQDLVADAGVVGDLVRVDLVGVGGDVVERVELVDARAGHPEGEPREDAAGQDDQGEQDDEDRGRLERRTPG